MDWFVWHRRQSEEGCSRRQHALVLALALCAAPAGWSAEDSPPPSPPSGTLDDLLKRPLSELVRIPIPKVAAASKWEQPITQAPASVTVVSADEIKKFGYRTLAEVLRSVGSLYITYDRSYALLGVRGFNRGDFNGRVLVLVDGHRINNNLSDGGAIGTDFILDVDLIEQVEVIRGPVATLYGNNAFFGIINVKTRRGGSLTGVGAEVSGEVASFDTYKGRVTWGHQFDNDLEMLFSGTYYSSEGQDALYFKEFDSPYSNNGVALHADGDQYWSAFGTVRWRDFTLQGAFITREKGDPTAPYDAAFNDASLQTTDERSYINLTFDHEFPDVLEVNARLYYDRYDLTRDLPLPPEWGLPLNQARSQEVQAGEWWGTELQLTARLADRHTLIFGGEYRDDFVQMRRASFPDAPELGEWGTNLTTFNYGIFLQGDFAIITNLHVNAGVRYDQYGENDPAFNPRAGIIYNPVPRSTIKLLYGSAFRAPNFFERTYGVELDPETIRTLELVYEQEIGARLRSSVSLYFNQIDDLIARLTEIDDQGNVVTWYQNIEGAEAWGVELALEGQWAGGLRGRLSYSFQDASDRSDDSRLTDSPNHLATFNVSVPVLKEKLFANLEFQYLSDRLAAGGTEVGDVALLNFTLFSQNLLKNLEISAGVYNLLGCKYDDPATLFHRQVFIEQDGRTFRVKVTYRF